MSRLGGLEAVRTRGICTLNGVTSAQQEATVMAGTKDG